MFGESRHVFRGRMIIKSLIVCFTAGIGLHHLGYIIHEKDVKLYVCSVFRKHVFKVLQRSHETAIRLL